VVPGVQVEVDGQLRQGVVEGYAWGVIEDVDGTPGFISGTFYQLAPFFALHGDMKFKRMAKGDDPRWPCTT
jgi:hypothetical protein